MDVVALAKFQFAFTVMYHFFFVPISIGLGLVTVLFERKYYKSGKPEDRAMSELWIKIFAATFAIGVATGITMEFAFGTNWATYSRFVGDIFGAPLAAEALFAFFLESTFLGVLIFGRNRVSKGFYYASTWLVWFGSLLSALWIIIANSWMQTPAGYEVIGEGIARKAVMTNFFAAGVQPVHAAALPAHHQRGAHHRRHDVCGDRRVPPAQGRPQGLRPPQRVVRADHRAGRLDRDGHDRPLPGGRGRRDTSRPRLRRWRATGRPAPSPSASSAGSMWRTRRTIGIEIPGVTSFLASGSFTTPVPGAERLPGRRAAADPGRRTRRITG